MTDVSDDDLEKIIQENQALRDEIAERESELATNQANEARKLQFIQLSTEQERLKAQLAQVTASSEVGNVAAGTEGLVAQAMDQFHAAEAAADRPVGPVDTNNPDAPKGTTGAVSGEDNEPDESKSETPVVAQPQNTTQIGGNS